ncbi:hypothetical protein KDL45_14750, partial [bacterium]|nr:hypothetical protein [bacterium]
MTESVGTEKPHLDIHFERALFVVGEQNSGKSKQLRSMFRDLRLGTKGVIPTKNRIDECYPLSVERWLYVRLTSPHEMDETPEDFLAKCQSKMCRNDQGARRWNFAGALQPTAYKQMPDAPSSVEAFIRP